jgi:hypothetical protein
MASNYENVQFDQNLLAGNMDMIYPTNGIGQQQATLESLDAPTFNYNNNGIDMSSSGQPLLTVRKTNESSES